MDVVVVGLSHRTARIEHRERTALGDPQARALLRALVRGPEVTEAVVLSTCNRTELYAAGADAGVAQSALADALVRHSRISADALRPASYALQGERAAAQLFRVAASLDSMVIGESEIQGQVREAWSRSVQEGACGALLNHLFRQALEVGKRVREKTAIGVGSSSVATVAVDLAREVLGDLPARQALVIGSGRMAEAAATTLVRRGVRTIVIANRTGEAARALALRVNGRGVGLDGVRRELEAADLVVSATRAPHTILHHADLAEAMASRAGRPTVVCDLAMPRDADRAVADVPGVSLLDLDDMEGAMARNLRGRRVAARRAEAYVVGAVRGFAAWRSGQAAAPAIRELRERAESIRRHELDRVGHWDAMSDADRWRIEMLTQSIVNKLLHEPTVRARAAAQVGDDRHVNSLRHLFGLEPGPRPAVAAPGRRAATP